MSNNCTISSEHSIRDALKAIDENSKGAVVVVDEHSVLVRLLTDGDIRRAMLDDVSLDSPVSTLPLNSEPIYASYDVGHHSALSLMDENSVNHLVLVDSDKRVTGLFHRKEVSPILLSTPHMGENELSYVREAFSSNWIAPLGPNVDGFEKELAELVGAKHAVALSSGTAAIHLGLVLLGVSKGDVVFCSSLTFVASANPIVYQNATPVFIDSEPDTWNMSPVALRAALKDYAAKGKKPKAIVVVNLYGQSADMDELIKLSEEYDVPIIEDAAESLGASYKGKASGTFGKMGVYSFNGNKIITTSGGGMLVSDDKSLIDKARFLATQARDDAPFYQHSHIGYNYRMSNILAGVGRGQLSVLDSRVQSRREVFERYERSLKDYDCLEWMPELEGCYSNRWLTAVLLNPDKTSISPAKFIESLAKHNIEARRVWKPMHLQPVFSECDYYPHSDSNVSEYLFDNGVCLPSGSNMTDFELDRIISAISLMF